MDDSLLRQNGICLEVCLSLPVNAEHCLKKWQEVKPSNEVILATQAVAESAVLCVRESLPGRFRMRSASLEHSAPSRLAIQAGRPVLTSCLKTILRP